MNDLARVTAMTLSISAVERDTGLSKDTLRVWERRCGFPSPGRDGIGERAYTYDQVEKLRVIKRLMDAGHRLGRIVSLPFAELQLLSLSTVEQTKRQLPVALASGDLATYLGLLMAEAMFALDGACCMSLGVQTPLWDIVRASAAHRADLVALSFSGSMNPNLVVDGLTELRQKLPPAVRVWAGGGSPVLHRRRVDGVEPMSSLEQVPVELKSLRESMGWV